MRTTCVVLALLASISVSGCKLFRKQHPSGKLARTALPAQYTDDYPDQPDGKWNDVMNASHSGAHTFEARDVGTLHVWLRYLCVSKDGAFALKGTFGTSIAGSPPIAPVPVTVTAAGAKLEGLPRGDSSPIVINAPRKSDSPQDHGAMATDGYLYLFDLKVAQQGTVTINGSLYEEPGSRCGLLGLEVWRD